MQGYIPCLLLFLHLKPTEKCYDNRVQCLRRGKSEQIPPLYR